MAIGHYNWSIIKFESYEYRTLVTSFSFECSFYFRSLYFL